MQLTRTTSNPDPATRLVITYYPLKEARGLKIQTSTTRVLQVLEGTDSNNNNFKTSEVISKEKQTQRVASFLSHNLYTVNDPTARPEQYA